jgi:hypothetical protein
VFAVASLIAFVLALILHLVGHAGSVSYDCLLFGAMFLAAHFAFGRYLPFWTL